ncbi:hypothetical protein B0H11DRAFT_1992683 [Mycena galericulata]|nr:hypothetical protein B0H11DRAFT_1992683 [Mycena galericulata]
MKQERRQLTIDSLYADIDWPYIHELTALLWVRILVHFIPQLDYLRAEVTSLLASEAMTKHRKFRREVRSSMDPSFHY